MPRFAVRMAVFAVMAIALTRSATAEPPNPLDLVEGLRTHDLPDLALQYLDEIAKTAPPDLKLVIPLEKARIRLSMADDEDDDGMRETLTAQARAELTTFLTKNATHPRAIEANVALARATAIQAKSILTKAVNIDDEDQRKAAAAQARVPFTKAAEAFGKAAAQLETKIKDDAGLSPKLKQQLSQELIQTELDRAVTTFQTSRTYVAPTAGERIARAKAIEDARDQFLVIAKKFPDSSGAWVAKAWAGECYVATDTPKDAEKLFGEVKRNATPTSLAGRRMVRFFESRIKFEEALTKPSAPSMTAARQACSDWLRDFGAGRANPEYYAVLYQDAYLKQQTARASIKLDENKQPIVAPAAVPLLREAERQYRRIAEADNEYSDRAARKRMEVVRLLIGNAERDPATIRDFDQAVMAAMVQFDNAMNAKDNQKQALNKVVALLERAKSLPAPRDAARELLNTQVRLSFAYLMADRPYQAAVLGDHLARTARVSSLGAKAGMYAVQAYLAAANKLPPDDTPGRIADRQRAIALGLFMDSNKAYAADPSLDVVREKVGQLLAQDGRHKEAFEILSRVNPKADRAIIARLYEGGSAFELIRPGADGKPSPEAATIYKRLVADINAIPRPPVDAVADNAELYARLSLLLAQAHLTTGVAGYPLAEKQAADVAKLVTEFTQLPPEEKAVLGIQAEQARLQAIYAQVVPMFRENKFKEVADRLEPELAAIAKTGPAVKEKQSEGIAAAAKRLDDFRRENLIVLALQTQIRLKSVEKAGELFDLLKRLGGSLDSSVQALSQLLSVVRPQIDDLKKDGKEEDVKALIDGMSNLLDKVAAEPNLTPRVQMFLGRGLKEIGAYEKAAEVLTKVPAPTPELLAKPVNQIQNNDERVSVLMYRGSRLDLARVYRELKKFDDADKILKEAMGTDEKPSWAKKAQDFRRESIFLLEAKAAAEADPAAAGKIWAEATGAWNKYANEFRGALMAPLPAIPSLPTVPPDNALVSVQKKYREDLVKYNQAQDKQNEAKRNKDLLKPLYFETLYESLRCLTQANAQVLKDKPDRLRVLLGKVADSIKQVEDNNKDLNEDTKAKLIALREKYPELKEEYEKLVKAAANPPVPGTTTTTTTPDSQTTTNPDNPIKPPVAKEETGGNTGMLIAGGIGAVAIAAAAGYILKAKKKRTPPRKYGVGAAKSAAESDSDSAAPRKKAKSKAPTTANGTDTANGTETVNGDDKPKAAPRKTTEKG